MIYFTLNSLVLGLSIQQKMANCFLTEFIKGVLDNGNVVGAVFLDLKKAFDTVNTKNIRNIRKYTNIRNNEMGFPQGSILGPLLFSLYVIDWPNCCKESKYQLYADDTVIYVSAQTPRLAADILTNEMTVMSQWLQNNRLTLNCSKTVSMCFSIRRKEINGFIIKINQKAIEAVNNFKYLGVILDSHLKFDVHVKRLCRTIRTNLNCFYMIRPHISLKAATLYMHAMVFSHLSYCVTV